MAVPVSPIALHFAALKQATPLKGVVQLYLGAEHLATQTAPGRIVIYPTDGNPKAPKKQTVALYDVEIGMTARIWGASIDECWNLLTRFAQALEEIGAGGGAWWGLQPATWNTTPDATQQGQAISQPYSLLASLDAAAFDQGHVGPAWPTGQIDDVTFTRST
jgi:hypothetical protein